MYEMMVDIETLDTRTNAIVLSIGAVIWHSQVDGAGNLRYSVIDRFMRVPNIDAQVRAGRTVSHDTLFWWTQQDPTARAEAFNPVRQPVSLVFEQLRGFALAYPELNHFWASPATFDFPIIETLADQFGQEVPWRYNQKYDVRTVVNEACYSAREHDYSHLVGIPHTPVYDCEAQVDLLTAARNRIARRIF